MTDFSDFDPEDEYDDSDSFEAKVVVLERVVVAVRAERDVNPDRAEARRLDAIRLLVKLRAVRDELRDRVDRLGDELER